MKIKFVLCVVLVLTASGCASTKPANVMPITGGAYKTTGIGESKEDALKTALESAEKTCSKRSMRHVISSEETTYKGVVSEGTNRALNKVGELASFAGAWLPSLGGDDDYHVTLTFSCSI